MKFDKETVIVILIALAVIVGYGVYLHLNPPAESHTAPRQTVPAAQPKAPEKAAPAAQSVKEEVVVQPKGSAPAPVAKVPEKPAPVAAKEPVDVASESVLQNDLVKFTFNDATGTIISAEFLAYKKNIDSKEGESIVIRPDVHPVRCADGQERREYRAFETNLFSAPAGFTKDLKDNKLVLTRSLENGLKVVETFELPADSYTLKVTFKVENTMGEDYAFPEDLTFRIAGLPPMKELSSDRNNRPCQRVDFCLAKNDKVEAFEPDPDEDDRGDLAKESTGAPVKWIGCSNKYFASMLFAKSDTPFSSGINLDQLEKTGADRTGYAIPLVSGAFKKSTLQKNGGSQTWDFEYYCGPKELKRIDALPEDTAIETMHIAYWSWFEFIARPLARFLVWLNSFIHSYGIAIIILTLIVRLILWPFQQKSNRSMRKMQKIQPKMKELRERFKDNPQELNVRMMELYRTEGVNPLGGCLPLLLQLPVFFALYSVFDASVELRHVPFLWAKDLAQPDTVFVLFNLIPINPFILLMTLLMVVQQKMTPAQGDSSQQKIMMLMPIIMLFILYNLPSGLTLYWTISNAFSIIQLKYGQRLAEKEEAQASGKNDTPAKAK